MPERDLFDEIARIAYELWERDGYIHGRDIEHWCEAENIVITHIQLIDEEKTKKAGPQRKKATTKTTSKSTRKTTKAQKPSGSSKKR